MSCSDGTCECREMGHTLSVLAATVERIEQHLKKYETLLFDIRACVLPRLPPPTGTNQDVERVASLSVTTVVLSDGQAHPPRPPSVGSVLPGYLASSSEPMHSIESQSSHAVVEVEKTRKSGSSSSGAGTAESGG